jgi:DNA repair protein RadC
MATRKTRPIDRTLREALAPYIDPAKLRHLAAHNEDLRLALTEGVNPPAEVLALLDTLAVILRPAGRQHIRSPEDAAATMMVQLGHLDQEHLVVLCLNTKNQIQKVHTVYVGSVNTAVVRVGEIFKEPIRLNSASIILCHNHPSGSTEPSPEDMLLTRQVVEAGKLLDIETLDHLVICRDRFVSMRQRGMGFPKDK